MTPTAKSSSSPVVSTAVMAAAARAAHLLVDDGPHILVDEQARDLVEATDPTPLRFHLAHPHEPVLAAARLSAAVRSRFAEDRFLSSGCGQYVLLGAGLDSSAHRVAAPRGVAAFHVDTPDALRRRRAAFRAAACDPVGVDVAHDLGAAGLPAALLAAGLDPDVPTFVSWLGVTMYLSEAVVRQVIGDLAFLTAGSRIVADVILPAADRDQAGAEYAATVSAATGASGEPWRTTVGRDRLRHWLTRSEWPSVDLVDEADALGPGTVPPPRQQRLVVLVDAAR